MTASVDGWIFGMDERIFLVDFFSQLARPTDEWLTLPGAPKQERPLEKPITVSYDELLFQWQTERDR